jgi:ABC-type transport system substrate-binding protein
LGHTLWDTPYRLAEALRTPPTDPDERTAIWHQFHALVHEEQPYTFFYQRQRQRTMLYRAPLNEPEFSVSYPYADPAHWSFSELPPPR